MKRAILFCLLLTGFVTGHAQWSNLTNQFYDSLDMPVARTIYDQKNPLLVKSQPDGGYFVIWEDSRNAIGNWDIYAQKYDKDGHMLWALNGVPVATGAATDQQYSTVSNGTSSYTNYQSVSHAATDGAGGFYITWQSYLGAVGSYGVYLQHIRNDGTQVFATEGYGMALPATNNQRFVQPQLVADGQGGFFIGYLATATSFNGNQVHVRMYCYKDEGGVLKHYGGGIVSNAVNYYGVQNDYRFCGGSAIGGYLVSPTQTEGYTNASSFKIFPDGQGGCGVVMSLGETTEKNFPAFNQLCRVKRDVQVETPLEGTKNYKKDSVLVVHRAIIKPHEVDCTPPGAPPGSVVIITYYSVMTQGALNLLSSRGRHVLEYDPMYPGSGKYTNNYLTHGIEKLNATVMPTDGNIDALLITWNQRNYVNSQVTNWSTRGVVLPMEKYDDIPYQLTASGLRPTGMDKINEGDYDMDTLLAQTSAAVSYDYSLTGSGGRAFMVSSINGLGSGSGPSPFYYQEAKLTRQRADSFAVKKVTSPGMDAGVLIGVGTTNDRFPAFAGDGAGNATFYYVGPNGRDYVKASPVAEGGKMRWGALGLPLNSGGVAGSYYYASSPIMYMDAEGKGLIAWNDGRRTPDGYTGENVYMRHLDSLINPGYQPPLLNTMLTVIPVNPTAAGSRLSQSNPQSLSGTSGAWTTFQVPVAGPTSNYSTPVAAIRDDYNLGTVSVSTYDFYNQPLRRNNGKAYMDRNYTISVTNHPPGASIHVRLIFTKAQFDAMKAADASIADPGSLAVVKQPSTGVAPATYTPSANDQGIRPTGWGTYFNTVDNVTTISGYYIEVVIDDFSNFFIMSAASVLPVTLQSFTVNAVNTTALLQWVTASELNNDHFDIERSVDGRVFSKIGRVAGNGTTSIPQDYRFTDASPVSGNNYYRLAQVDIDGHIEQITLNVNFIKYDLVLGIV
ncbi:MAG: hypothetical protein EOO09_12490 [Chitinophagaceae bacterium]|nr:MAG: hypothetical protein EOO09_12490 [Chitinophagaceae bacterium]